MKSNIKLITGHYIVFIGYWILEFQVFDKYFDKNLSGIFSHLYLYFIAAPLFTYIIRNKKIKKVESQALKIQAYVKILILQSGLSVGVLKIFSIIEKSKDGYIEDIGTVDIFILLLFAPVFEELFYRRIILTSLKMEKTQAIFLSAFLCLLYNKIPQSCRGDSSKLQREFPQ